MKVPALGTGAEKYSPWRFEQINTSGIKQQEIKVGLDGNKGIGRNEMDNGWNGREMDKQMDTEQTDQWTGINQCPKPVIGSIDQQPLAQVHRTRVENRQTFQTGLFVAISIELKLS